MLLTWLWQALYWSWLITEIYVLVVTRTRRGKGTISDRGSLVVLWTVIVIAMSLGGWAGEAYTPAAMHLSHSAAPALRDLSVALLAVGLCIRWTAIYSLGRSFSANVAIHATQKLNRSGLFHYMRHPSYTGMVIIFFAVGLRMENWLGLLLVTLPPYAALLYRIHVEEDALIAAFGDDYLDYQRTTRRLIPGLY
jgi:protein-S-isoprenylcysteine O-methyltransferase Ste14